MVESEHDGVEIIVDEEGGTGRALLKQAATGDGAAELPPQHGDARLSASSRWGLTRSPR